MERKTKIIATIGPSVAGEERIQELVDAGMNVARLNFSHGDYDTHRRYADWIRRAAERSGTAVALLQDIQGPRIRIGEFPSGSADIETGTDVVLRPGIGECTPAEIFVENLDAADIAAGSPILLADGLIVLEAHEVTGSTVRARVLDGGHLRSKKGVIFPGAYLDIPAVTEKDERDLEFGRELEVDIVAASFVTSGDDIRRVRKVVGSTPVIAKIERALGYENLDDILEAADGAMVARGDLGVELSLAIIPRAQKDIIMRTNAYGAISITATEMLESMTAAPRPTRAEVTDVANAVLDGTDAVMLSAETAVGKHPIRAVLAMDRICREAEASPGYQRAGEAAFLQDEARFASAIAQGCVDAAANLGLSTIVAFTESGSTARLLSKYRPRANIFAFTPVEEAYRRMALYAGVHPMMLERVNSTDEMVSKAEASLLAAGLVEPGEAVVIAAGVPPNERASTNLIKLHVVGSESDGMRFR